MTDGGPATLNLLVRTIRYEAPNIVSIELVHPDGEALPHHEAGAHVDLTLPNGLARSYSLFETSDRASFWVAVLRDRESRGGSAWIHDRLRPGAVLPVAPPTNNFALVDPDGPTVLIAGGIGVTPVLAQLRALVAAGNRDVAMLYA
ncbi:MAG: ferredoxin reductase, partial [Acidimicrobiales bacterium]